MATRKVSITLDEDILKEAKARAGARSLSAYLNELVELQLHHQRIDEFLADAEQRAGPIPGEIMEEARREWLSVDDPPATKTPRRSA